MSKKSDSKSGLSRRKFLLGSAATAAGAAVTVNSERANAFFNLLGFMKKPAGNGQTSNGYVIGQSLRFNYSNGANLSRTVVASDANTKQWIWSGWFKTTQSVFNTDGAVLLSAGGGGPGAYCTSIGLTTSYQLRVFASLPAPTTHIGVTTTRVFRDPSAWYHIVVAVDTTQASYVDGVRIWVNGVQETSFAATTYTQNVSTYMGVADGSRPMRVGACTVWSTGAHYDQIDGYMAETYLLMGATHASPHTLFGQVDSYSGQWIPKSYSGTAYGTNGFYLTFNDSASLGADSSGRGNNFAANSVQTHDQVLDSPTNNFCTWNPIGNPGATTPVFSNGALTSSAYVPNATNPQWVVGTQGLTSGKWYWEVTQTGGGGQIIGVANIASIGSTAGSYWVGAYQWTVEQVLDSTGVLISNYGASVSNGSVIGIALDLTAMTIAFSVNGVSYGVAKSALPNQTYVPVTGGGSSTATNSFIANFGQGGQIGLVYDSASGGRFKYAPPAGFKALSTVNFSSNMPVVTSGAFTGNASSVGPFVWLGGAPTDLTINGNAVTWGTHADKLANGFKIRTSSASYNVSGSNSFSATVPTKFKWATAR